MKYSKIKNSLIELYEKACHSINMKLHKSEDEDFIIYRGFKVAKKHDSGYIYIVNVRNSDFYKPLTDSDLKLCLSQGFEEFCDRKQVVRDERRITLLTNKIRNCIVNGTSKDSLVSDRGEIIKRINSLNNKYN